MATKTITRRIKTYKGESAREALDSTRAYVIDAYGLEERDGLRLSYDRAKRVVTATITTDGPRRGWKWEIF